MAIIFKERKRPMTAEEREKALLRLKKKYIVLQKLKSAQPLKRAERNPNAVPVIFPKRTRSKFLMDLAHRVSMFTAMSPTHKITLADFKLILYILKAKKNPKLFSLLGKAHKYRSKENPFYDITPPQMPDNISEELRAQIEQNRTRFYRYTLFKIMTSLILLDHITRIRDCKRCYKVLRHETYPFIKNLQKNATLFGYPELEKRANALAKRLTEIDRISLPYLPYFRRDFIRLYLVLYPKKLKNIWNMLTEPSQLELATRLKMKIPYKKEFSAIQKIMRKEKEILRIQKYAQKKRHDRRCKFKTDTTEKK